MNDFSTDRAAFDFTISGNTATCCQAVFHRGVKVEEAQRRHASAVTYLTGQHSAAAKTDITTQHFAFYGGENAGL
ncbi:hypothetical protein SRABI106_04362 [Rahnella aquatilis]|nr:hypothetical protein SRABI106_04362 [Rahnella aquatilis]